MVQVSNIRDARSEDLPALVALWHAGWHEAHAAVVPQALVAIRTPQHLAERLDVARAKLRVAGPVGAPLGFHLCHGDELEQFYVGADARGTGLATALLRDAEARIAETGAKRAWLACAIGNMRASRFYEREGWHRTGTRRVALAGETAAQAFELKVWVHERALG